MDGFLGRVAAGFENMDGLGSEELLAVFVPPRKVSLSWFRHRGGLNDFNASRAYPN